MSYGHSQSDSPCNQLTLTSCWCLQVTNPPIDPLREGLVMSLEMRLGKRGNLLTPGPDSYSQVPTAIAVSSIFCASTFA